MKMTVRRHAALVVAATLFCSPAYADEPAAAVVTEAAEIQLKNGETRRGTIVAVEPGQRVIVIVAGAQSVIPWNEVARIVGGPQQSTPAVIPETATAAAPEPVPVKGKPMVQIESNWPDAELARIDGYVGSAFQSSQADQYAGQSAGAMLSKYVCRAPCNKIVDGTGGHRFFISAPGMFPSPTFRLDEYDGPVTARVHGTSYARFAGGVISVAGGGVMALGGGMFFGMSYVTEDAEPSAENPNPEQTAKEVRNIGMVIGGIGIAAVVTGALLLSTGTTRIEIIESKPGQTGLMLDGGVLRF